MQRKSRQSLCLHCWWIARAAHTRLARPRLLWWWSLRDTLRCTLARTSSAARHSRVVVRLERVLPRSRPRVRLRPPCPRIPLLLLPPPPLPLSLPQSTALRKPASFCILDETNQVFGWLPRIRVPQAFDRPCQCVQCFEKADVYLWACQARHGRHLHQTVQVHLGLHDLMLRFCTGSLSPFERFERLLHRLDGPSRNVPLPGPSSVPAVGLFFIASSSCRTCSCRRWMQLSVRPAALAL